jgi:glyoxylase-like metal-dependent hydrolase (beta-lactamase superfamily II)
MKRKLGYLVALAATALSLHCAMAQQAPAPAGAPSAAPRAPAPLAVKLIRDNVYWAAGGVGGNSGIIVGDRGIVVIDAKQTPDTAKEMIGKIGETTPKPITDIILTGYGGEGIPGLAAFPAGIKIHAHADTNTALKALAARNAKNMAPADKMPNDIITGDRKLLTLNGVRMVFLHIAPSHTVGESAVYLPDQRIVFTGFITQGKPDFPVIHPDGGGSAEGWMKFMKALIDLDADTYVIGAGDIWTKVDMEQRLSAQKAVYAKIKDMVVAGQSHDKIRAALGTNAGREPPIYMFSEVAYDEIAKTSANK